MKKISEKWKEAVEEGSQLFTYPTVDAEKTLANQAVAVLNLISKMKI